MLIRKISVFKGVFLAVPGRGDSRTLISSDDNNFNLLKLTLAYWFSW